MKLILLSFSGLGSLLLSSELDGVSGEEHISSGKIVHLEKIGFKKIFSFLKAKYKKDSGLKICIKSGM